MTEYSYGAIFSGVMFRVIPWQKAIVTPYAHVGISFTVDNIEIYYNDGSGDDHIDTSSFGLIFGGGLRLGPPESFMIMLEAGWRTGEFETFFQLRAGLAIEL